MRCVRTWSVAMGSAAALAMAGVAGSAAAQSTGATGGSSAGASSSSGSTTGGPGGLGTEVPLDSQAARNYFNYSLPSDTAQAKRVQDGIQKLHADYQAIIQAASAAEAQAGVDTDARRAAQQLKEDAQLHDQRLVEVARDDERLDPSGPAYDAQLQQLQSQNGGTGAGSSASSQPSLADVAQLTRSASSDAATLEKEARKDSRQQLASILNGSKKTLSSDASRVASAADTRSTSTGSAAR